LGAEVSPVEEELPGVYECLTRCFPAELGR